MQRYEYTNSRDLLLDAERMVCVMSIQIAAVPTAVLRAEKHETVSDLYIM